MTNDIKSRKSNSYFCNEAPKTRVFSRQIAISRLFCYHFDASNEKMLPNPQQRQEVPQ